MRNIWRIFVRDVRQSTRNVIAVIVAMGLVIMPSLYAWYNIAASWDPYGNTKALKVAVANVDKGYKSELMPVTINVGETVTNALRANHQLDWQFVDKDKAIDGVHSGEYYAALVIPKSFSADMMTLFSDKVKHAKLEYYLNEKINPIAPHITDQGASTVATTIDQTFVKTLGEVALNLASSVADYAQSPEMSQYVTNATEHLSSMSSKLTSTAAQIDAYSSLLGAANDIITSTDKLLGSAGSGAADTKKAIAQASDGVSGLDSALTGATSGVKTALGQADSSYDSISKQIDAAFDDVNSQSSQVSGKLTDLQAKIQEQADGFGSYASALDSLSQSLADQTGTTIGEQAVSDVKAALDAASAKARDAQTKLSDAAAALGDAAKQLNTGTADADAARQQLKDKITAARQSVSSLNDSYNATLKPQLDALASSMNDVATQTGTVVDGLSATISSVSGLSGSMSGSISDMRTSLADASSALTKSAAKLDDLSSTITSTLSGGVPDVSSLTSDPDTLATVLSAPVSVNRIAVYPIANYGSAMTPFYTVLSIWVGAIILVAMLKVSISDHEKAKILGLGNELPLGETMGLREAMIAGRAAGPAAALDVLMKPRPESPGNASRFGLKLHQEYFGRYMIFGALALMQGTLVCLGDLLYLGVQCEHPLQFLLTGWLAALVFSSLMYTLTVSFGDIGKAIAVVLLVVQVAGTGGTFPIETLPTFFQILSRWLLFPYAVDAMHAAMAGSYGMEYWVSMGKLALFLVPVLLLGLVLRKPVIRLNDWIIRNLESTKVM
ncbi:YhgE/Pip domain-containing protein [Bifidobacterium simiiventris]|uniref:YhgE/Pip domain-containing protein n=1 Tax=Bifidobacterium simiiventris TaxID=2834434 RepID=UPI001C5623D4|nr:YhgE/Pip domain-containing protein [Bifidobacterium simiiventris]MBW3079686.1 YhgE/Pip domain-containing protein [Bifidobacterium simiiventris]